MKKLTAALLAFSVAFLVLVFSKGAIAQPPPIPTVQDIPIDGGLGFLIASGIVYAGRRLYSQRQLKKTA